MYLNVSVPGASEDQYFVRLLQGYQPGRAPGTQARLRLNRGEGLELRRQVENLDRGEVLRQMARKATEGKELVAQDTA